MEIALTPEQEAHLVQIAEHEGKDPGQLVFDAVLHLVNQDADDRATLQERVREADRGVFLEAVQRGLDQADAGDLIEEDEMDARFEKMISAAR